MKFIQLVSGGTVEDAIPYLESIDGVLKKVAHSADQVARPPQAHGDPVQRSTSLRDPSLIPRLRADALYRICSCTRSELGRFASSLCRRTPTDELAWHSRNIYELNLLLRWILESDSNLTRLWEAQIQDDIEIFEGLRDLVDEESLEEGKEQLLDYAEAQKRWAEEHSLTPGRLPKTYKMANAVGLGSDHRAFYKVYSKLVHPTAWKLNTPPHHHGNWVYKNLFLSRAQLHAIDTATRAAETLEVSLDDIPFHGIAQVNTFTEADTVTQSERDAIDRAYLESGRRPR